MTSYPKPARLVSQVKIDNARIGGRVRFSRDGSRILESRDGCLAWNGAAQTSVFCAVTGTRIGTFVSEEGALGTPFHWSDPDLKRIGICDPSGSPTVHDIDTGRIIWDQSELDCGSRVHSGSTFISFSPLEGLIFESNLMASVFSNAEASISDTNYNGYLLAFRGGTDPCPDMDSPWPYVVEDSIWVEQGLDRRTGYPPFGIKTDPVWSRTGFVGAATVFWGEVPRGGSLLPGVCHSNGDKDPLWRFNISPMGIVWKADARPSLRGEGVCDLTAEIGLYLPPYALATIAMEYSENGAVFLLASQDGSLRIYDSKTGECVRVISFLGQLETAYLSSDGGRIVAFSASKEVSIISTEIDEVIARYPDLGAIAAWHRSVCGKFLMLGLKDGRILKIESHSGRVLAETGTGLGAIEVVRYAGGGQFLIAGDHRTAEVLESEALGHVRRFNGAVLDVSSDGVLVCFCEDGVLTVAEVATAEKLWSANGDYRGAEFSFCGRFLTCWFESRVESVSFDASTGDPLPKPISKKEVAGGSPGQVRLEFECAYKDYIPDLGRGAEDVSGYLDYRVRRAAPMETFGQVVAQYSASEGIVTALAFKPDLSGILLSRVDEYHDDGPQTVICQTSADDGSREILAVLGNPSVVTSDISALGDRVLTVDNRTELRIWSTITGRVQGFLSPRFGGRATLGVLSSDGAYAITANDTGEYVGGGETVLWDIPSGQVLARKVSEETPWTGDEELALRVEAEPAGASGSLFRINIPDDDASARTQNVGRLVGLREARIFLKDWSTGVELVSLPMDVEDGCLVVFSGDRSRLCTYQKGRVILWDGASGVELAQLFIGDQEPAVLKYSPDGSRLVMSRNDRLILLGGTTGTELVSLKVKTNSNDGIEFSEDGTVLLVIPEYGPPTVFNASNGAVVSRCMGHVDPISDAKFSPNGESVLVSYQSGSAAIWGRQNLSRPVEIVPTGAGVQTCSFSLDGSLILAVLTDGSVETFWADTGRSSSIIRSVEGTIDAAIILPDGQRARTLTGTFMETWDIAGPAGF